MNETPRQRAAAASNRSEECDIRDERGRRFVTVDTGWMNDVFPNALVSWLHVPRGGYGYTMSVDAKVLSHERAPSMRVTIEITTKSGRKVRRVVDADTLRWHR